MGLASSLSGTTSLKLIHTNKSLWGVISVTSIIARVNECSVVLILIWLNLTGTSHSRPVWGCLSPTGRVHRWWMGECSPDMEGRFWNKIPLADQSRWRLANGSGGGWRRKGLFISACIDRFRHGSVRSFSVRDSRLEYLSDTLRVGIWRTYCYLENRVFFSYHHFDFF
jgi:hypothetical protein